MGFAFHGEGESGGGGEGGGGGQEEVLALSEKTIWGVFVCKARVSWAN